MKSASIYLLSCILVSSSILWGQEENHLFLFEGQSQWTNPSNVGLNKESTLQLLINSQWLGIKDAPKQQSILFNSRNDAGKIYLGGGVRNRSRFGEQNIQPFVQSAFPIQIDPKTIIQLGFQVLGDFYSSEYNYLRSVDGINKDLLLQQQRRFIPNFGIGFTFTKNTFWIKGAIPRLLDQQIIKNNSTVFLKDQLYFFTELGVQLPSMPSLYTIKLSANIHNLGYDQLTVQLKGALSLRMGEFLLGINSSKNVGVGFEFYEGTILSLGYFFQFPFSTLTELSKTNHSLSLRFKLSPKKS